MIRNTILEAIKARDLRLRRYYEEESDCEIYRPSTMDEAWKLAESFVENQFDSYKKTNLILVAKKYKNNPNVDIIKFLTKNDELFIEKIPSDGLDFNDDVFTSYYVKDCKTGNAYYPQTTKETWQLVDDLMP